MGTSKQTRGGLVRRRDPEWLHEYLRFHDHLVRLNPSISTGEAGALLEPGQRLPSAAIVSRLSDAPGLDRGKLSS